MLEAAGSSLDHVVKAMVYLPDSSDFQGLDEVWREFFPTPARPDRGPRADAVPDARLEIYTMAVTADGPVRKGWWPPRAPHADHSPVAGGPCRQPGVPLRPAATDFAGALAPAAQISPHLPWHDSPMRRQAEYVLTCAEAILEAADTRLSALLRWQAYMPTLDRASGVIRCTGRRADPTLPIGTVVGSYGKLIIPEAGLLLDLTAAVR